MERLTYIGHPRLRGDVAWAANARAFHRSLPDYVPTPLITLPHLASSVEIGRLLVKSEVGRFGLPSFKILGASYATAVTVQRFLREYGEEPALTAESLRTALSRVGEAATPTLSTATDGNHGRAVARAAQWLGIDAKVFVPSSVSKTAQQAIIDEGATLQILPGDYDEAVEVARSFAASTPNVLLVQDTSWPGYHDVPELIVNGYTTLFDELLEQADRTQPLLLVVPIGVGSLAMAALQFAASQTQVSVLGVEPDVAPSVTTSLLAGAIVSVATRPTIMAGLNCGTISYDAWPWLRDGLSASVTVNDVEVAGAVHDLARAGVDSGPCGAATLAGLRVAAADEPMRDALKLDPETSVILLSTESRSANPLPDGGLLEEDK
ncbi:diaminopropionate ammonia-lyase [Ornithinimicrobium cryptoxanthini]|uniref:diaminopropionate ammonia-lyase n=1 Tax=Ornithinimicrobium cryptoxanthini TaxID=2934161 RepID=UPI002118165B